MAWNVQQTLYSLELALPFWFGFFCNNMGHSNGPQIVSLSVNSWQERNHSHCGKTRLERWTEIAMIKKPSSKDPPSIPEK